MTELGGTLLTPATVLAEAARLLTEGGYRLERDTEQVLALPSERALVAEDKYGVVFVVVYDTWSELSSSWPAAQSSAVGALSTWFTKFDRKAWDGYLVVLTPALAGADQDAAHAIRYNTSRLRKIVATGEHLQSVTDVGRVLLPLLPLAPDEIPVPDAQSVVDELPEQVEGHGASRELAETAVRAFREHRSILEELHRRLAES